MHRNHDKQFDRPTPPLPKYCRICKGELDPISEEVIDYDIYTSQPKTTKYVYACRNSLEHTKLVVLENPAKNFRAVIREDRFDERMLKK